MDSTRWPHVLSPRASHSMSLRIWMGPRRGRMNNIVWILVAATLAIGSGSPSPLWRSPVSCATIPPRKRDA
jgi:hypothetical protein